ncbi:MAG TPA: hypothetical protein VMI75_15575 [Polyangiaceae bacterium]|nr:hypothetical protein [Polyangiaceae bacterium]
MPTRTERLFFGVADLLAGALVAVGVFAGLPARWWPVDVGAGLLATLDVAAGVALLVGVRWAPRLVRVACAVSLALGLLTVTVGAITASWLAGVYGPIGSGGALILGLVAALVLPYAVALPLAQLVWLRPRAGEDRT